MVDGFHIEDQQSSILLLPSIFLTSSTDTFIDTKENIQEPHGIIGATTNDNERSIVPITTCHGGFTVA